MTAAEAEEARAKLLELFPEGFEESPAPEGLELAAYTDAAGERRLRASFAQVRGTTVEPGWEDRWRSFHRPVRIGPVWIGPPWEDPPAEAIRVVIDPGRAFGTGAHPTTRLALELLLELEAGSLLDVGCGSGVLAIAAAALGFVPVHAVDVDPAAVEATGRNARRNGVALDARIADARRDTLPATDVAVANIALDVVEAVVPKLHAALVVTSGYLDDEVPTPAGVFHAARRTGDGWAADLFRAK